MKQQASTHMEYAFLYASRNIIIEKIIKALTPKIKKFDSIVVSGYSMALIGSIVAHALKKNIVLVRKAGDNAHTTYVTEGLLKQRCVYIDDLVATGDTFQYVNKYLKEIKGKIVGVVLYFEYHEDYKNSMWISSWDNTKEKMIKFPIWERFNISELI